MPNHRYPSPHFQNLLAGFLAGLIGLSLGCYAKPDVTASSPHVPAHEVANTATKSVIGTASNRDETLVFVEQMRSQVDAFCGDCHVSPKPANVERDRWQKEVEQGFEFYRISGRDDLKPPPIEAVTRFFQSLAPERLAMPTSIVGSPLSSINFQSTTVSKPAAQAAAAQPPCISALKWLELDSGGAKSLVYCDLGTGTIYRYQPESVDVAPTPLAVLFQPAQFAPRDLNNDQKTDLVVADLGEFLPSDSDLGRVVWLKRREQGDQFDPIVLQDGLGRVSDVSPADFDGDGDVDIVVAEFGWRKTGRVLMLDNQGTDENGIPKFDLQVMDNRHGSMEVPVVDLNGDGLLDFVVLFSQEFECIEAFINLGHGKFEKQLVFKADDPTYGSARIEVADLDGDGDQDVVYANGDSFDTGSKAYHSVQWLENNGKFPFEHHHIAYMPGVLAIKVADFDNDGDVDIVAGSLVAKRLDESFETAGVESLIMLEQIAAAEFKRTKIETSAYYHGAIGTGDFDGDGRVDIAVGNFLHFNPTLSARHDFTIWKNLGPR